MKTIGNVQHDIWKDCDVCGFAYPLHLLRRQDGTYRCLEHCYDQLGAQHYRAQLILPEMEGVVDELPDESEFAKE